jgi:tetratricopeptide (TPR) repeat protein
MRDVHLRALEGIGRTEEAIAEGDRIIASAGATFGPTSMAVAYAMMNTTRLRMRVGDVTTAVDHSRRVLEVLGARIDKDSREYAYAQSSYALALIAARRFDQALPELDASLHSAEARSGKDSWDAATLRYQRAFTLASLGRGQEARAEIALSSDARTKEGDEYWVERMQGSVALLTGEYDVAVTKLQAAEQLLRGPRAEQRLPPILTHLGLAQLERGDPAAALTTLTRALQFSDANQMRMNPTYADVLSGIGRAHVELHTPAAALAPLERADAFWRDFDAENVAGGPAAYWLYRAYAESGRKADADAALARARALLVHSPLPSHSRLLAARH